MRKINSRLFNTKVILITVIISIIAYFLHVTVGRVLYDGYNPLTQTISDLTADDSPVKHITRIFTGIYSILSVYGVIGLSQSRLFKQTKSLKIAVYSFMSMIILSAIGYTIFPLSAAGYQGTFQDVMHMIITSVIVVLTLLSLFTFAIGFNKPLYRTITRLALAVMLLSPLGMALLSDNYFGIFERLSVYTVVLYLAFLAYTNRAEGGVG